MTNHHVRYLLIGGGLASSAAAQAIRKIDPAGSALLVGQEINRPYHRPPLSKEYLRREKPRTTLFAVEPDWYETNHVSLRTGRRVSHLDTSRMAATLDTGEEISFDSALIATGGAPVRLEIPGAYLPGVFYLRTLEDSDRLHTATEKALAEGRTHARGRGKVTVLGGGTLGVEIAASLTQVGLAVDLVLDAPHPWSKFSGTSTGQFLSLFLEQRGILVHGNERARRIEGDGRVQRVILADEHTIDADFVVAAVGMTVPKDLLRGTPIAAETAILTDDRCRTSVPGIWAAGDCAAPFDPLFGKHRLLDHWDSAVVTGSLAGRNMAGENVVFGGVNYFFSDVFDLSLQGWGESRLVYRHLLRGTPNVAEPHFAEIGVAVDGRVAQVLCIGPTTEADALRELVARRMRVDGLEEQLKDPQIPLASLLR